MATRRVGAIAMMAGMAVGVVVLGYAFGSGAVGWTWYALIGASVSGLSALAISLVMPVTAMKQD